MSEVTETLTAEQIAENAKVQQELEDKAGETPVIPKVGESAGFVAPVKFNAAVKFNGYEDFEAKGKTYTLANFTTLDYKSSYSVMVGKKFVESKNGKLLADNVDKTFRVDFQLEKEGETTYYNKEGKVTKHKRDNISFATYYKDGKRVYPKTKKAFVLVSKEDAEIFSTIAIKQAAADDANKGLSLLDSLDF